MLKKAFSAFVWILLFQVVAYILGQLTKMDLPWYQGLHKSILTPPDIVFSIVWGVLYVMLALAGWSLWLERERAWGRLAFSLYWVQIVLHWAWTPLFFTFHFIQLGFYLIVLVLLITFIIMLISLKYFKLTATMLFPYWLWLLFTAYLNWVILLKN